MTVSAGRAHRLIVLIRIEDDVLITSDGPDVLSAGIPKEIRSIQNLVGSGPTPKDRFVPPEESGN